MTGRRPPDRRSPDGTPSPAGHYFEAEPASASRPGTVRMQVDGETLELRTDRGVFSPERIDAGTSVLLGALGDLSDPAPGDLVDLGCGYGPIALSLALRFPQRRIWAVEVNERARGLCRVNAAAAGVGDRVQVVDPTAVPEDLPVAAVVSNPPIRVGKAVLHEMLSLWLDRLVPGGEAWLVVHRHLGADSLAAWLAAEGWTVTRRASRKGYRVLRVQPPA